VLHKLKAAQSRKLRELQAGLLAAGFHTIEEQSRALGICRSTAWTIVTAAHKGSGLSAAIINRMLAAPQLPMAARAKILEYVLEKADGQYGHSAAQCRKFIERIAAEPPPGGADISRMNREARHQEQPTLTSSALRG
jgi:hypothetical protein